MKRTAQIEGDQPLSKAIALMIKNGTSELIVTRNKRVMGIITAQSIAKRNVNVPNVMKTSKLLTRVPRYSTTQSIQSIVNTLSTNSLPAVLLKENHTLSLFTPLQALHVFPRAPFQKKRAEDIMTIPFCASKDDTLTTAQSLFRDLTLSVLPVLDHDDTILGYLDPLILIRADTKRTRSKKGEQRGEHISLRQIPLHGLIKKVYPIALPTTPLPKIITLMEESGIPFVLIHEKYKMRGIITPQHFFRYLLTVPTPQQPVTSTPSLILSGLSAEDPFILAVLEDEARGKLMKFKKIMPVQSLIIRAQKQRESGRKKRYTLNARLLTKKGDIFAQSWSWDATKAMKDVLDKIEVEIRRKKGKQRHL